VEVVVVVAVSALSARSQPSAAPAMKFLEELLFECLYYFANEIVVVVVVVDGDVVVAVAVHPSVPVVVAVVGAGVGPGVAVVVDIGTGIVSDFAYGMHSDRSSVHFERPFVADMDLMEEFPLYCNSCRYNDEQLAAGQALLVADVVLRTHCRPIFDSK